MLAIALKTIKPLYHLRSKQIMRTEMLHRDGLKLGHAKDKVSVKQ